MIFAIALVACMVMFAAGYCARAVLAWAETRQLKHEIALLKNARDAAELACQEWRKPKGASRT